MPVEEPGPSPRTSSSGFLLGISQCTDADGNRLPRFLIKKKKKERKKCGGGENHSANR